jgi:hypothetical protein
MEKYKCVQCDNQELVRAIGRLVCPGCDVFYIYTGEDKWFNDIEPVIEEIPDEQE